MRATLAPVYPMAGMQTQRALLGLCWSEPALYWEMCGDAPGGAVPCVSSGLSSRAHLSPVCAAPTGPTEGSLLPINICRWVVLLVLVVLLCSHEGSLYLQPTGMHWGCCSGSVLPHAPWLSFLQQTCVCLWAAVIQLNFFLFIMVFNIHDTCKLGKKVIVPINTK